MSESKYLIQGSTLTAIANALRVQGGCFDNLKPSQMTSYIQNKLMSYGVFDAIISDPTTSSAIGTTINSSLLLNASNSRAYMIKDTTLTSIANALRNKGAFSDAMTAAQMPSYIQNKIVSQGLINDFYNKTLSEIHNYTATKIGTIAFQDCVNLHTVEFTECTTVGSSAFKNCTILSNLSLPKATTVNASAFVNCKSVASLTIGLTNISSNTVTGPMTYSNPNLEYVSLPNCIAISGSTFQNCTKLSYVYAPIAQALYQQAFRGCTALKEIELPLLGEDANNYVIGQQAFQGCTALETASFACVRGMNPNAFSGCTSLKKFYAPCLVSNSTTPFNGVTTLEDVTVGYSTIPALFSNQSNLIKFTDTKAISLAENALRGCSALTQNGWNFGASLTVIGKTAFMNCIGITELSKQNFPRGTTTNSSGVISNIGLTIGVQAFQGCVNISKITLNDISGILSANAFSGCTGLTSVSLTGTSYGTFTNLSTTPFNECTNLKSLTLQNIVSITTANCCANLPITDLIIKNTQLSTGTTITANLGFTKCSSLINLSGNFTSVGTYTFQSCIGLTSLNLNSLTSTAAGAFAECTGLTKVSLPNLINLSSSVFRGCTNLSEVYAPKATANGTSPFGTITTITSLTTGHATIPAWSTNYPNLIYYSNSLATNTTQSAFQNCTQLNENRIHTPKLAAIAADTFVNTGFVSIVTSTFPALSGTINHRVFKNCLSLEYVDLPTVTNLQQWVFSGCTKLSYLSVPAVTTVYTSSNQVPTAGCTALEFANFNGMTTIPYALFTGFSNLKSVYVNGATTLAQSAFRNCSSLTTVYMNNMVTLANSYVFENCTALNENGIHADKLVSITKNSTFKNTGFISIKQSQIFPNLTSISHYAFESCANLTTVDIPKVTYIGAAVFRNCTALKSLSASAATTIYTADALVPTSGCTNLEFANFNALATIPRYLFTNLQKLKTVNVNAATTIAAYAFQSCNALTTLTLPKATLLQSSACIQNTGLTNVQIGDLVQNPIKVTISAQAFSGCTNLETISILHTSLATLQNSNAFNGTKITSSTGKIIVPSSLYTTYKTAAQWSYFSTQFTSIAF